MENCVSPEVIKWLLDNKGAEDFTERLRMVVARLPRSCKEQMCSELGISEAALYAFTAGRTATPRLIFLSGVISWLAPGYRVNMTLGTDEPVVCDPNPPAAEMPRIVTQVTLA